MKTQTYEERLALWMQSKKLERRNQTEVHPFRTRDRREFGAAAPSKSGLQIEGRFTRDMTVGFYRTADFVRNTKARP